MKSNIFAEVFKNNILIISFAIIMGVCSIAFNVGLISTSAVLISSAALHPDVLDLMVLIVGVRFFGIFRGIFRYFERIVSHNATLKMLSYIRKTFYKSFNESYSEVNMSYRTGDIYTNLINDIDTLKEYFLRGLYPVIISTFIGVIFTLFISFFNVYIGILYFLIYCSMGIMLPYLLFCFNKKNIEKEKMIKQQYNEMLLDNLNGIQEIAMYNLKHSVQESFNTLSNGYMEIDNEKNNINIIGESISGVIETIMVAISLIIGAIAVRSGTLQSILYAVLPLSILASFEGLKSTINVAYKINEAKKSKENIFSVMKKQINKISADNIVIKNNDLEVKNLSIIFDEKIILDNISFTLPKGKKIAIVGETGSGKTSILRALMGFIPTTKGDINIGHANYSDLDIEVIRDKFTYMEQDTYLFNTTLEENLKIANKYASQEKIEDILDKANLRDVSKALSNGEKIIIGKDGVELSGGERGRVALARAMLKDSPIVLLDEPTANLDASLEKQIMRDIQNKFNKNSMILVTHKLVNMEHMDEILVLDKGAIIERGTHYELLNNMGVYEKLFKLQKGVI